MKFLRNVQLTEKPAVYRLLARALSECLTSEADKNSNLEKYSNGLGHDLVNVCKYENLVLKWKNVRILKRKDSSFRC